MCMTKCMPFTIQLDFSLEGERLRSTKMHEFYSVSAIAEDAIGLRYKPVLILRNCIFIRTSRGKYSLYEADDQFSENEKWFVCQRPSMWCTLSVIYFIIITSFCDGFLSFTSFIYLPSFSHTHSQPTSCMR